MSEFRKVRFDHMPAMLPLLDGKRETKLLEPFVVSWEAAEGAERQEFTIPAGFTHDGPSTPGRLRGALVYTHRQLRAAVVHDFMYATHPAGWPRKRCDRFYLDMMEADKVGRAKRRAMWGAVRVGGWRAWRKRGG